ncbi:MAG: polyhydroxyalkanoate synthesis repressor PhaR [Salaquimonas sp.]
MTQNADSETQTKDSANDPATNTDDPVVIKRYASRKLYDAAAKEYVTLEDIARYIRAGREVQIIDKKTGEDLTRQYLIQIIADFESQGETALPLNVLTDLVRHYQDQAKNMTPAFLSQVFEAFKEQQEKVIGEFGNVSGKVFDPKSAMEAMQIWQEKQTEFFSRAMQGWGGLDMHGAKPKAPTESQGASPAKQENAEAEDPKSKKIEEMEAHLKALQEQLNKLR